MRATSLSRVIRRLAIMTLIAWHASSVRAQSAMTYPSVLTYRTVRVAEGVYAFITPEERTGFQSGNSIAIVGDDGVLVFDTGNIPGSTRRQIAEIRKLTNKPRSLRRQLALASRSQSREQRVSRCVSGGDDHRHVGDARRNTRARAHVRRTDEELRTHRLAHAAAVGDRPDARQQQDARQRAVGLGTGHARLRRLHARSRAGEIVAARPHLRRQSHALPRETAGEGREPGPRQYRWRHVHLFAGRACVAHGRSRDDPRAVSQHVVLFRLDP